MDHYADLEGKKRTEMRKRRLRYFEMIIDIIKKGMASKEFRAYDPEDTALAFLGMCNWAYKWYPAMAARRPPEQVAQSLCGLFLDGLRLK